MVHFIDDLHALEPPLTTNSTMTAAATKAAAAAVVVQLMVERCVISVIINLICVFILQSNEQRECDAPPTAQKFANWIGA